jgi:hypothetical protein
MNVTDCGSGAAMAEDVPADIPMSDSAKSTAADLTALRDTPDLERAQGWTPGVPGSIKALLSRPRGFKGLPSVTSFRSPGQIRITLASAGRCRFSRQR